MSLGKNIYELRTGKNLSQGNLADLLDVSRQSVSKWETDSAIPDLDKLMKMCDVFGVTLDELTCRAVDKNDKNSTVIDKHSTFTPVKIIGCILLTITFVASILLFLLAEEIEDFYIPFPILLSLLACSIICLCVKNNIGYWCTWFAISPICFLSFHIVGLPILATASVMQIIICVVMAFVANKKFKDCLVRTSKTKTVFLVVAVLVVIAGYASTLIFSPFEWISMCFINYVICSSLALLITYSVCYVRALKQQSM